MRPTERSFSACSTDLDGLPMRGEMGQRGPDSSATDADEPSLLRFMVTSAIMFGAVVLGVFAVVHLSDWSTERIVFGVFWVLAGVALGVVTVVAPWWFRGTLPVALITSLFGRRLRTVIYLIIALGLILHGALIFLRGVEGSPWS